jgi:hypothetical protein
MAGCDVAVGPPTPQNIRATASEVPLWRRPGGSALEIALPEHELRWRPVCS